MLEVASLGRILSVYCQGVQILAPDEPTTTHAPSYSAAQELRCGAGVDGAVKDAGPERERSAGAAATARVLSVYCPAPPLPDDL